MFLPATRPTWQLSQHRTSPTRFVAARYPCGRPASRHSLQQQHLQQLVLTSHSYRHVALSAAAAAAAAAEPSAASSGTSSSTAIQLSRLQRFQDMLGDMPTQQQPNPSHPGEQTPPRQSSKKAKAVGFGGQSSGSNSSRQQQQQPQVVVKPLDSCPCKSGLQYQACCQPFLSGEVHPRSAPELARARITAALTGDVDFLVASTHPDSSLALGGSRDLARRTRRQAAIFRESKPAVVGMAHCRGDTDGSWIVLAILQATAGEFKGTKAPAMYTMVKRGSTPPQPLQSRGTDSPSSSSSSSSSRKVASANHWLYMGQSNKIPQHEDADAIWQLLQLHVPELLQDNDSSSSSSSSSGMTSREVYFMWGVPALGLPTAPEAAARQSPVAAGSTGRSNGGSNGGSSGSQGEWYLDLLQPGVESLPARSSSSSNGGAGSGQGVSRGAGGVISMDALIAARNQ